MALPAAPEPPLVKRPSVPVVSVREADLARRSTRIPSLARTATNAEWMYEVELIDLPLPVYLLQTPIRSLLGKDQHDTFMRWMRRSFVVLTMGTRVGMLLIFVSWVVHANIGRLLVPIATVCCLPALFCSSMMMSSQLLKLLVRQHEFWWFTLTNCLNWGVAAMLFSDVRGLGCVICFIATEHLILMDANFRTVVSAMRVSLLWIPALAVVIVVCTTRLVDINPHNFHQFPPGNKINFTLVNAFLNNNMSLMIFFMRKTYRRRRLLTPQFLRDRIIPCTGLRSQLVLKRVSIRDTACQARLASFHLARLASMRSTGTTRRLFRRRSSVGVENLNGKHAIFAAQPEEQDMVFASLQERSIKDLMVPPEGRTSLVSALAETVSPKSATRTTKSASRAPIQPQPRKSSVHMQELRHVPPTLAFLDMRDVIVRSWLPLKTWSVTKTVMRYGLAVVGMTCGGVTMYLPKEALTLRNGDGASVAVPACAFLCTLAFVFPCILAYQRDLVWSLLSDFEFLFSSWQFLGACICLCSMMAWDFRCLALAAWALWFHWILMLDALTPAVRVHFRLKRVYAAPVLVGILLGIAWIMYSLFFSHYDALEDHVLGEISWGTITVSVRTSTLLVGRLGGIVTWSLRLVYKVFALKEDELLFIRGSFEYRTPYDIIPATGPRNMHRHRIPRSANERSIDERKDGNVHKTMLVSQSSSMSTASSSKP